MGKRNYLSQNFINFWFSDPKNVTNIFFLKRKCFLLVLTELFIMSVCLSVCLPACLSVCLSVCLIDTATRGSNRVIGYEKFFRNIKLQIRVRKTWGRFAARYKNLRPYETWLSNLLSKLAMTSI